MFDFTDEQKMVRQMLRKWGESELAPNVAALEREEMPPYELMRKLVRTFGLPAMVRKRFEKMEAALEGDDAERSTGSEKGMDADPTWGAILMMELARFCPGFVLAFGASMGLAGGAIMARGTFEQKKRWALPVLTFDKIGAWGMTEPDAGSDAFGGMRTTARPDGDGYVLNGQKTFITNAPYADTLVVYAKITRDAGEELRGRAVHAFVVERGTPGLETPPPMRKMGMHSSPTGEIFLADCRVPAENLLGGTEESTARDQAKGTFHGERTGMTPMCLGMIERCLDDSVKYAKERKTWGRAIGEYQLIQDKLARMYVHRENVRNLLFKGFHKQKAGLPISDAEASATKLYCARATTEVALDAIQIMGGNGYMQEFHVEMLMRDAKLLQIGGGTDEIQITRIARELLAPE